MRARRLAPVIAAAAVALVALVAVFAGPVEIGDPVIPFQLRETEPEPQPTQEAADDEHEDEEVPVDPLTVGIVFYVLAVGIGALVIASIVLTWLIRWLMGRRRDPAGPDVPSPAITVAAALRDATELAIFEAEAARAGEATDAVIASWVILEEAAASAGTPREAPQTPTEFTASVLAGHHADPVAVRTLLGLYHEARFGQTPLPDEAAAAAAAALRTISASLLPVAGWREEQP
jgi:hypothetical protein